MTHFTFVAGYHVQVALVSRLRAEQIEYEMKVIRQPVGEDFCDLCCDCVYRRAIEQLLQLTHVQDIFREEQN